MSGLLYIMGFQVVILLLPLLLPLFFLPNNSSKLKSYLILLILVYGIVGLSGLPLNIYANIGIWFGVDDNLMLKGISMVAQQVLGFTLSIIALNKYGQFIINSLVAKKASD